MTRTGPPPVAPEATTQGGGRRSTPPRAAEGQEPHRTAAATGALTHQRQYRIRAAGAVSRGTCTVTIPLVFHVEHRSA
uniref:Uncharacterized protein n=1 Tax=Neobacillus citreus TaxID=2833578 RepID=A0A942SY51_9BACI